MFAAPVNGKSATVDHDSRLQPVPAATFARSERRYAQAALVRYAEEIAARLARASRNDRGAIDSPLFANV
jgi:hypothetical protein